MIRLTIPEIGDEEIAAVADVLRSGMLVQGEHVQRFERAVADYVGVTHAVAVSSGTAALHLALLAAGIGSGDEVIVPDFTFPATANVVELVGATPVLVDIDLASFNIDVTRIHLALTVRTKAIMPVHLFGQPADMAPLLKLAREHGVMVIEDAACALGATYHGRQCGGVGDVGCFSFHPRKAITTGEGGMVVTDDGALAERVRLWRNHGMEAAGVAMRFVLAGLNYRMTEFQAAMGTVQMRRLEEIIGRRAERAAAYDRALAGVAGVSRPLVAPGCRSVWQSYVVLLDEGVDRDRVARDLRARGIEVTIGTYSVSAQPHFRGSTARLPGAARAFAQALTLPLYSRMSELDIRTVSDQLGASVSEARTVTG